jgi:ligand-binding SRPBCC domain-containing protein
MIPRTREDVFEHLRRPDNLLKMFPSTSKEKLGLKAPDIINLGDQIEFSFHVIGMHIGFVHKIVEMTMHERIFLNQIHGPLKLWATEQHLSESDERSTLLKTVVKYEPPGGVLGFLLTKKKMRHYLEHWVPIGLDMLRDSLSEPQRQ